MKDYILQIADLEPFEQILALKTAMLEEPRYASIEQARIITRVYKGTPDQPAVIRRARALKAALEEIEIRIDPGERIVGNRTKGVRHGVVFPETGASWIDREFETLPTRPQDRFNIRREDVEEFRREIYPYWKGLSLEDKVRAAAGTEIDEIARVVKINQKDHSQGHICPNTHKWLRLGPAGLQAEAEARLKEAQTVEQQDFYLGVVLVMQGARSFIRRYADLALRMNADYQNDTLHQVAQICAKLADEPAQTYHQALQATWFLYVILQMEGNASSFSPGRMDQYLYPYFRFSRQKGMSLGEALNLTEHLWLKFNEIVYLRNANSAKYFAGFPIGFNVAIGGQRLDGTDASNELSYLFLQAQAHLLLPQPNLSLRVFHGSPQPLLEMASRVIGKGGGIPQLFNDEAVIPALKAQGISHEDAVNYAIVGCVELTTHGNSLGWSDAAMFNMVKVLELTLTGGIDLISGERLGGEGPGLTGFAGFENLEEDFARRLDGFIDRMVRLIAVVDSMHAKNLPTPFLSSVIDDCLSLGCDVTQGGAHYNFAGVQAIQMANVADSLAAIRQFVFDEKSITAGELLDALKSDFEGQELLRLRLIHKAPKYGNGIAAVDELGAKWARYFADRLRLYKNRRGGNYQMGLYTVSAHVPMGQNVGASADGRRAGDPLADGGVSAMYGRDTRGPTALLQSVSALPFELASNGALLNLKFLPQFFRADWGIRKFVDFLRAFCTLGISHVQFNVISEEDLRAAQKDPIAFRGLTVRVAGYTAYFVELTSDLQEEIIARRAYDTV